MPASAITTSYCGPPPLPDDLWGRWNFDPILLAVLAELALGLGFLQARRVLIGLETAG